MCSSLAHTAFNLVLTASIIVLIVAAVTPAWHKIEDKGDKQESWINRGIFYGDCIFKHEGKCFEHAWQEMKGFEKATAILLVVSIGIAVFTWIYSCCLCLAFCCRSCFVCLIPLFCILALVANTIAILVYIIASHKGGLDDLKHFDQIAKRFGYSLYLAIVGAVGLAISVLLGFVLMCTTKVSPV